MGCNYPVSAYRLHSGEVVFSLKKGFDLAADIKVACGECIGCKMEKARTWAIRCMHEASLHQDNSFVTLTYNDENMPDRASLDYSEFQLFMKRLRKRFSGKKIRFYMAGEYGEENDRPHYHVILFGLRFPDLVLHKESSRSKLYTSKILDGLWAKGFCTVGDVTFESAQYVARYILKKQNGKRGELDYQVTDIETGEVCYKEKEMCQMSRKPGIGREFYEKYKSEIFPVDRVVMNGMEMKPPKYYHSLMKNENRWIHEEVQQKREKRATLMKENQSDERLLVREKVQKARIAFSSKRSV